MNTEEIRTFIYKVGDEEADKQIKGIINEGWSISCETPNGTIRITTFSRISKSN